MAEYTVKEVNKTATDFDKVLTNTMNQMARDGWRVVCVHSDSQSYLHFITFVKGN